MHKRYAKDGLEVVSVSLDDPGDPAAMENALRFLRSMRPGFPNFLLADRPPAMQQVFAFAFLPCVFVFDQAGQARKFEGDFAFGDVERVVRGYLKH